jgi:hypothetical protein
MPEIPPLTWNIAWFFTFVLSIVMLTVLSLFILCPGSREIIAGGGDYVWVSVTVGYIFSAGFIHLANYSGNNLQV